MRLFKLLLLFLFCLASASTVHAESWLVKTTQPAQIEPFAQDSGLRLVRRYRNLPWAVYERSVPPKDTPGGLQAADISRHFDQAGVIAQLDLPVSLALIPNDPLFPNQTQFSSPPADADIHLTEAWDTLTSAPTIVVAVIDSGILTSHAELLPNLWTNDIELGGLPGVDDDGNGWIDDFYGWNTFDNNNQILDTLGHGTQVSGIIGAQGNNGAGISGVCWDVKIMTLRAFANDTTTSTSRILDAIDYILNFSEVRIVNASWGDTANNQALADAINELGSNGVLVVAAAGNAGVDLDTIPFYPASLDYFNVVSVAAINQVGDLAGFSSYGSRVSIAAPGVGMLTTNRFGDYSTVQGTSFSTPVVSAAAALLLTRFPLMPPASVKAAIVNTSRMTPKLASVDLHGRLLDMEALLNPPPNAIEPACWLLFE